MARASVTDVISHWHQLLEGLRASPLAFYDGVEPALDRRQIPQARRERVDWHEAGALSAGREYLRVTRARHVMDICGAPFGSGFFVSWWLAKVRAPALIPTIVALVVMGFIAHVAIGIGGSPPGAGAVGLNSTGRSLFGHESGSGNSLLPDQDSLFRSLGNSRKKRCDLTGFELIQTP